jgi:hypothetical protein
MGNFYDGWLESGIQDAYDDYEEFHERVEYETNEDLKQGSRFYPFTQMNWAEATSELGMAEEISDMNPADATQELRDKVVKYWYELALRVNEKDLY